MRPFAALCLSLVLLASSAQAQGKKSQVAVPDFSDAPLCETVPDDGAFVICRCEAGSATGSVWGSGPYTADSSICAAGVHSGVIGAEGGVLQVVGRPGEDSYDGSDANGVSTRGWGSYGQSFDVTVAAAPATPGIDLASLDLCATVPDQGEESICKCEAGSGTGSVWGSGPYTADSNICAAAVHSGVIVADGGALRLVGRPGEDSYEGTEANGVLTSSWGSYGQSFDVQPASAATTMAKPLGPVCDVMPDDVERQTCSCLGDVGGSVWGSGPYTADSNICSAARHAGIVGAEGGTVTVIRLPGLDSYTGSEANGEVTAGWDSYDASIVFDRN